MKLKLYHATDSANYKPIKENGFIVKENDKHWLGNGVYFFLDLNLAEWWATKPSKNFGCAIENGAILNLEKELDDNKILDLRRYKDYVQCLTLFNDFMEIAHDMVVEEVDNKRLRCAFFDCIFQDSGYDCIIGCFTNNKSYLDKIPVVARQVFEGFDLPYVEIQVCVKREVINQELSNLKIMGDTQYEKTN